jgi:hypothetical protein
MRLLVALLVTLSAGAALAADGVVPEADKPDVVYIGEGWAPSLTNGCADRGACKLPELPKTERRGGAVAIPPNGFNFGGRDCTGSLQGVAGIRQMYDLVSRCIGG